MFEKLPGMIGHALREQRAGMDATVIRQLDLRQGTGAIQVASMAFVDHGPIPELFTADGDGTSPPLHWTGVPEGSAGVVVLVEDADSPTPHPLVHAIAVDLPGQDGKLHDGDLNEQGEPSVRARLGRHSLLGIGWLPPDPPPGHGLHHYVFQVYALSQTVRWDTHPGRDAVIETLQAHAVASGWMVGTYTRPDGSIRDEQPQAAAVRVMPD